MSYDYIILSYNEKKKKIKAPNNFEELKNIFFKKFNEDKNKKFYFSYLSFIDKDIDFIQLKSHIKDDYQPTINVFKEKEKDKEKENEDKKEDEEIIGISQEHFLKIKKKMRKKQKHLEEKKKENEEKKEENKLIPQNSNNSESSNNENEKKDNNKEKLGESKTLNKKNNQITEKEEIFQIDERFIKKLHSENYISTIDLQPSKEIVNDAYNFDGVINAFCVFESIDNILYIVYTTRFKSIISFNIVDNKKIKEIKNAHNDKITNFRHYLDKINIMDLIISISSHDNNIKLWNLKNLELLYNFENINESGSLKSACFLEDNKNIYIIVSNSNNFDKAKPITVYDLKGNKMKEINNSKDDTYFIDTYFDKINNKNYIITGNYYDVKSYDYNENKLYYKYFDQYSKDHNCAIINDTEEIIKLIESSKDGNVRVWDFHTGKLINKISVSNNILFDLCLWDNKYLFVGCGEEIIKLIDLKIGKKIKTLHDFNSVISLKKINHPQYGQCLISQGNEIEQIMLWIKKN